MEQAKKNSIVFSLLLLFGIFFPTSINGIMGMQFYYISFVTLAVFFFCFINKSIGQWKVVIFLIINLTLLLFSITASSEFPNFSFGIYPNFLALSLLFFLDLRTIKLNSSIKLGFLICTFLIIAMGIGVLLQIGFVLDIIKSYYIASYKDLVPNMLALRKPVGTFATHSVSALFIFIFFYLNVKSFKALNNWIYMFNAILLLLLLFFIRSNTSLLYTIIAFYILYDSFRQNKISLILISLFSFIVLMYFASEDKVLYDILDNFELLKIVGSDKNGIVGRYNEASPLRPTIVYILANPFSPVGLTVSDKLYYSDSGFILYILRGSIILMCAIYVGLYKYLRVNLTSHKESSFVLFVILLFEIGYPILINVRMLFFLPFLVIYLNFLLKQKKSVKS